MQQFTGILLIAVSAALFVTLEPVVTVLLAAWLLDERLTPLVIPGGGLILAAVLLLTGGEMEKELSLGDPLVE